MGKDSERNGTGKPTIDIRNARMEHMAIVQIRISVVCWGEGMGDQKGYYGCVRRLGINTLWGVKK